MADDFLTVDPDRYPEGYPTLNQGEWIEYYCPGCERRLATKYGLFFHATPPGSFDYVDHGPLCGGRDHAHPGPLLAKVRKA